MTQHNHITRDIKAEGICPACDEYHDDQKYKPRITSKPGEPLEVEVDFDDDTRPTDEEMFRAMDSAIRLLGFK